MHAVLGAALVAVSTHLVVWIRGFPRGRFHRLRGARIFAAVSAALFVLSLLAGNLIYPVYKVRVRAEYLEQAGAVVRDFRERLTAREQLRERYEQSRSAGSALAPGPEPAAPEPSGPAPAPASGAVDDPAGTERLILARSVHLPRETAKVARWFDVKEHWAALGAALALACMAILLTWNPRRHGKAIASVIFLMALGAALSAWAGAVIGVVVTSYRSIGGLG